MIAGSDGPITPSSGNGIHLGPHGHPLELTCFPDVDFADGGERLGSWPPG